MKNIVNIEFARKRFDKVKSYYAPKGLAPQLSQLRIETDIVDGQGSYEFDLKKENLSVVENGLKRNDLFVCLGIGVFLRIANPQKPGTAPLMTHTIVGTADGSEGFKTADIEALYNGSLYISTGTTVNIQDMPTMLFKSVKEVEDEFNFEDDIKMMAEEIIFAGTQDHRVKVNFPTFANADYSAKAEGGVPKLVFVALGYRVVGGTLEKYREQANPYNDAI